MKKQIFAAAAALCLMAGTSVFAQNAKNAPKTKEMPTPEQMAQKKTDRMIRELNLSEAQSKQVYDVNLNDIQQMQAMRKQMRESRNAEAEKMKTILSTEQFVKWAQMQQGPGRDDKRGIHPMRDCTKGTKACKDDRKPCGKQGPEAGKK